MSQSLLQLTSELAQLQPRQRVLLLTPGPRGGSVLPSLLEQFGEQSCVALEAERSRLTALNGRKGARVIGRATRLPFRKHSFDAILSIETLFSVRPPWTTIAEFHRVLVPDGKLVLVEPQSLGFFSSLRDSISGPGKRVFPVEEIRRRLARADWQIAQLKEELRFPEFPRPVYMVLAIKKENPVEPVPQYSTAQEMIARRKKYPKGEELP
jgi:SAM-dependent methyltransferase